MTEKDAIKCLKFAENNWWYLPAKVKIRKKNSDFLLKKVRKVILV